MFKVAMSAQPCQDVADHVAPAISSLDSRFYWLSSGVSKSILLGSCRDDCIKKLNARTLLRSVAIG